MIARCCELLRHDSDSRTLADEKGFGLTWRLRPSDRTSQSPPTVPHKRKRSPTAEPPAREWPCSARPDSTLLQAV